MDEGELSDPVDCGPLGSSICGILQARILEWIAFPSPGDLPDPGIDPLALFVVMLPKAHLHLSLGGLFLYLPY